MAAYGDRFVTFYPAEMTPGIKAIALPGHTPGHTGFDVTTNVGPFVIRGDICHAPEVQCPRPDVTVVFDVSLTDAIESRRKTLARAADEDLLIAGMHMPFPGFTHIVRSADAYAHHPEVWQYERLGQGCGRNVLRVTLAKQPITHDVGWAEAPRAASLR